MLLLIFNSAKRPISFISRNIFTKNEGSLFSIVLGPTASVGGDSQHPLNWKLWRHIFFFFSFLCILTGSLNRTTLKSWCRAFVADTDSLAALVKK